MAGSGEEHSSPRRARTTAVASFALLALLAACGDEAGTGTGTGSGTAPSSTTSPVADVDSLAPGAPTTAVPAEWFAVEHRDDRFVLVRGSTDSGEIVDLGSMPDDFGAPETSLPVSATDLAVTDDGSAAYVAFCCEPVSGSIFRFPTSGPGVEPESFDQGNDLDIRGDIYVRSDTIGVLRWSLDGPVATDDESLVDAGALDAAAVHAGDAVVGALTGDDGSILRTYREDGTVVDDTALPAPHCLLAGTGVGLVAMTGEVRTSAPGSTCRSDRFTVITPEGAISEVQVPDVLQDLEADATGDHLVGVDRAGNVVHLAPGDELRPLTGGRQFVTADW